MLKLDYSVFIQIANFLVLLFLLNIVLYRPIRRILRQRRDEIQGLEAGAAGLLEKAAIQSKDLEESATAARREGYKQKESLKAEGVEQEKKMYQEATASAGQKMEQARREAYERIESVRGALVKEVDVFSREMAEKILGRSL